MTTNLIKKGYYDCIDVECRRFVIKALKGGGGGWNGGKVVRLLKLYCIYGVKWMVMALGRYLCPIGVYFFIVMTSHSQIERILTQTAC